MLPEHFAPWPPSTLHVHWQLVERPTLTFKAWKRGAVKVPRSVCKRVRANVCSRVQQREMKCWHTMLTRAVLTGLTFF